MAVLLSSQQHVEDLTVSIIIPVYNCAEYIDECLNSIINQNLDKLQELLSDENETDENNDADIKILKIELSIYDDASTDTTYNLIQNWIHRQDPKSLNSSNSNIIIIDNDSINSNCNIHYNINNNNLFYKNVGDWLLQAPSRDNVKYTLKLCRNMGPTPKGVGFARNRAVEQSTGNYLCFCDADDIMLPNRIAFQLKCALENPLALIGSTFIRLPNNSTHTLTTWANNLTSSQLYTQIFTSFGPTLVMPTWFCSRALFSQVGGFNENGHGVAEDLIFFYNHLNQNGQLLKVDSGQEPLMIYRHYPSSTTFSIPSISIWNLRLERLQATILVNWSCFTIWNAGKLGRRLFRSLSATNQHKVIALCDVDPKKINQQWYDPYPLPYKIPIISFRDAKPPFIICVKTELTFDDESNNNNNNKTRSAIIKDKSKSSFLSNLNELNLIEGLDYYYFN